MPKITVALADDHQLVRHGIRLMIETFPEFEVVCEAANGHELLKDLEDLRTPPDIALIDISMPVMDGYDTIRYIARHHQNVKCIALSVHNDFNTVFKIINCGARGYLQKDISPEFMKETMIEVNTIGSSYNSFVVDKMMEYEKNAETIKTIPGRNAISKREIEFIENCCSELTYKQIAKIMNVSPRTIDGFRESIFKKLGTKTRIGVVLFAFDAGLYTPEFSLVSQ